MVHQMKILTVFSVLVCVDVMRHRGVPHNQTMELYKMSSKMVMVIV